MSIRDRKTNLYDSGYRGSRIRNSMDLLREEKERAVKKAADRAKWDPHWLGMAHYHSRVSKDPSTKVGAVIIRPDGTPAGLGFNGFARGMCDDDHLYDDRAVKYSRVIHGEMNAILNAYGPVHGCTLYTTPFAPCDRCAVMVIQAGIRRVVAPSLPDHLVDRWGESLAKTAAFFEEASVEFNLLDVDLEALLPTPQG